MTNLTETAYYTRKGMKIGVIILAIFFFLRISVSVIKSYWQKKHPPEPEKPTVSFGKLPKINFPAGENPKITNFQLETPTGDLPSLKDRANVYFIPGFGAQFLALEKAQKLAEKLNLNPTPEKIREDIYRFSNNTLRYTLTINVLSGNLRFFYPYLEDQTLINPQKLPTKEEAWKIVKDFLSKINLLYQDLEDGKVQITYFKIQEKELVAAPSASEADLIRIDLFRQDIENQYQIMSKDPQGSLIYFLISGAESQNKQIVDAVFNYSLVDFEKSSTYPIKTSRQAFEELEKGNYYLARLDKKDARSITIRQLSLGYFEPTEISQFLQPIFIFQGDSNFTAYLPAVTPEWMAE